MNQEHVVFYSVIFLDYRMGSVHKHIGSMKNKHTRVEIRKHEMKKRVIHSLDLKGGKNPRPNNSTLLMGGKKAISAFSSSVEWQWLYFTSGLFTFTGDAFPLVVFSSLEYSYFLKKLEVQYSLPYNKMATQDVLNSSPNNPLFNPLFLKFSLFCRLPQLSDYSEYRLMEQYGPNTQKALCSNL